MELGTKLPRGEEPADGGDGVERANVLNRCSAASRSWRKQGRAVCGLPVDKKKRSSMILLCIGGLRGVWGCGGRGGFIPDAFMPPSVC